MRIVVVTGGRNYMEWKEAHRALTALSPDLLVQGGAHGADLIALNWAKKWDVPHLTVPARWRDEGRAAGPKRNGRMLDLAASISFGAVTVLYFPGGAGTASCVAEARRRGLKVVANTEVAA